MITSPYPYFHSLSREISQMQSDYRQMKPLDISMIQTAVGGLRQEGVPVLTDGSFANQLAIVRGHGREGYMTVVLDASERALTFFSRFSIPVVSPDYMTETSGYWEFVMEIGRQIREAGKIPVLTVGDAEWLLGSMVKFGLEKLSSVFAFNQDYALQFRLQDKFLQHQLAAEAGLPTPDTWTVDTLPDEKDIRFPVLIKERSGKKFFRETGKQAFEASSGEELKTLLSQFQDASDLIVQEKVSDNGHENMYSIGAYCNRSRRPEALFSSKRLRATRPFGSTAVSESAPCPEGIKYARDFLSHIRYYGSSELEFIYDSKREQLLFLELNNRLYKTQALATHCGVNLNYLALLDALGKPFPRLREQVYGPRWWLAWADIASGIRKISKGELSFKEVMEPLSFDFINGIDDLDDPVPGFVNLFEGKF